MSDNRPENRTGLFFSGFLIGSAIGAVTGLLLAPRSGRETRRILKKSADALPELAEDLSSSLQFQADRLSASALRNWDETLGRLREALSAGIEASQAARQIDLSDRPLSASAKRMNRPDEVLRSSPPDRRLDTNEGNPVQVTPRWDR